jgi:hypothetical protein
MPSSTGSTNTFTNGFFEGIPKTRSALDKRKRQLARIYHPNKGGNENLFKNMMREYSMRSSQVKDQNNNVQTSSQSMNNRNTPGTRQSRFSPNARSNFTEGNNSPAKNSSRYAVQLSKQKLNQTPSSQGSRGSPAQSSRQSPEKTQRQNKKKSPRQHRQTPKQNSNQSDRRSPGKSPEQSPIQTANRSPDQTDRRSPIQSPKQSSRQTTNKTPIQTNKSAGRAPQRTSSYTPKQTPRKNTKQSPQRAPQRTSSYTPKQTPRKNTKQSPQRAPQYKGSVSTSSNDALSFVGIAPIVTAVAFIASSGSIVL